MNDLHPVVSSFDGPVGGSLGHLARFLQIGLDCDSLRRPGRYPSEVDIALISVFDELTLVRLFDYCRKNVPIFFLKDHYLPLLLLCTYRLRMFHVQLFVTRMALSYYKALQTLGSERLEVR